jgi:tetratricopeptide (TPR) repeat protein
MRKPSALVRRGLLGVFILLLIGGNIWVVRRQFPPAERRKNEAYDAGLRALTTQQDFAAAELHFRVYLEVDDRKPHVHYLLGLALQQQGKLQAAGEAFRAGISLNDNLDDARLALAEIAKTELDYLEALKQLNAAIAQDPTPASVYQYRGDLMVEIGDRAAALADYEETVRRDTVAYRAYLAMGDLLMSRGLITHSALDTNAAASHFRAAKEICLQRKTESNKREMLIAMAKAISGEVRTSQDRSLEEAIKLLEEVRDLDPDDPEPVLLLGDFFRRMGDNKEAERTLTSALRRWRTSAVFLALHDLYKDLEEFGKARTTLDDAIKEDSADAGLRIRLIAYLVERGEFDDAEQEAQRAGALMGEDFRIHEALGDLATERSRRMAGTTDSNSDTVEELHAESLLRYERALALRPQSLRLKKKLAGRLIESFLRRGEDAVPTEEEKQARTYLEDVLQVNRLDTEALAWKARFRLLDGEYEGVVNDLEPALQAPAPSLDALRILGVTAHRIGRDQLAVEAFRLVVVRLTNRNRKSERDDRLASATDWRNLAGAELATGNLGATKREARDGRLAWPNDRELTRLQAIAAFRLGELKQARDVLKEARRVFPGDVALRLLYAKALEESGDQKGAEREFRSALDEFPDKNTRARYFAYLARTGRASEAEDGFLALVASEPDDPEALLALGDFYVRQGPQKHALALVQYEKAFGLTESPGSPLLRMVELHLIQAPRDPAALLAAQDAAARFANVLPEDPLNFYIRGKLALAQGQSEDALAELDRYLELREKDATAHFYRSRALRAARRLPEAQVALKRARTLAP